jgi:hypothetical protein
MHRDDNSKFLLYIEPPLDKKTTLPVVDEYVTVLRMAIQDGKEGVANYSSVDDEPTFKAGVGYRGVHTTECGEMSNNHDYLLENGMITNSLGPYYLMYYREAIPESDLKKLAELCRFFGRKW